MRKNMFSACTNMVSHYADSQPTNSLSIALTIMPTMPFTTEQVWLKPSMINVADIKRWL